MIYQYVQTTMNPSWFHGHKRKRRFFEGWYSKVVTADGSHKFAIIIGMYIHPENTKSHAFIQLLDGISLQTYYFRYPIQAFLAPNKQFDITIGENHLCRKSLRLNLIDADNHVHGELRFSNLSPFPKTWFCPGTMGPGAWLSFPCNHYIVSLDHCIDGYLNVNGNHIQFDGGKGYTEKDWGTSFPSEYIWQQSNHFESSGTSLSCVIGNVPVLGRKIKGYSIGLWHKNQFYNFANYNNTKFVDFCENDQVIQYVLKKGRQYLQVVVEKTPGGVLLGPNKHDVSSPIHETINSIMHVSLWKQHRGSRTTLFKGIGLHTGLEIDGDMKALISL